MKAIRTLLAASTMVAASMTQATVWTVQIKDVASFPTANLQFVGFTGLYDDVANAGSWHGTLEVVDVAMTVTFTQSFSMNETNGRGQMSFPQSSTCVSNSIYGCSHIAPRMHGSFFNTAVNPDNVNIYRTPEPFVPTNGWSGQWALQLHEVSDDGELIFTPLVLNIGLSCIDCNQGAEPDPLETPIPASAWLLGSGLLGLAGAAKRRKK